MPRPFLSLSQSPTRPVGHRGPHLAVRRERLDWGRGRTKTYSVRETRHLQIPAVRRAFTLRFALMFSQTLFTACVHKSLDSRSRPSFTFVRAEAANRGGGLANGRLVPGARNMPFNGPITYIDAAFNKKQTLFLMCVWGGEGLKIKTHSKNSVAHICFYTQMGKCEGASGDVRCTDKCLTLAASKFNALSSSSSKRFQRVHELIYSLPTKPQHRPGNKK